MADEPFTLAVILRVPPEGLATFQAYEDQVLPLLADHGGALERRLRSAEATTEIHLIRFASSDGFAAFRADPRRAALAGLFARSGAVAEVSIVSDVV